MTKLTLFIFFTLISQFAFAGTCNEYSPNAKFECANAGDEFAASGKFGEAKDAWKISCAKGLNSSCDSVKELEKDAQKFKSTWESDPTNKASKEYLEKRAKDDKERAENNAKVASCLKPEPNKENCLSVAKSLASLNETDKAITILNSLCKISYADACFEVGGIHVRAGNYDKAIQPYMAACSLGNSNSCVILQQVQTNVKMKAEENAREEEKKRQLAEDEQRRREKLSEDLSKASKQIGEAFVPKTQKRTVCNTKAVPYGGLTTECSEY